VYDICRIPGNGKNVLFPDHAAEEKEAVAASLFRTDSRIGTKQSYTLYCNYSTASVSFIQQANRNSIPT
jgi:hypothetical protein